MKFLHITWYLLKTLVTMILAVFYFLIALGIRIFDRWKSKEVFVDFLRLYFKLFGFHVQYSFSDEELKEAGNTVFVPLNQTSFLDSMVTPTLPVQRTLGILNIELGLYPILGWYCLLTNFVIIRQWPKQAKNTLNGTYRFLKSGGNIIISIEGKRSKDGMLNPYKKGPVVMAINSQSDIVPFIIGGTFNSLPYGSLYTKPGNIKVKVLAPVSTRGLTYENRNEIIDLLLSTAQKNGLK